MLIHTIYQGELFNNTRLQTYSIRDKSTQKTRSMASQPGK